MAVRRAFVFNLDDGELERKALLLAASLRDAFGDAVELVASVPRGKGDGAFLTPPGRQLVSDLDLRLAEVDNPMPADYPIGYKLMAPDVPVGPDVDVSIFLDSDMLCTGSFDVEASFPSGHIGVLPAFWPKYPQKPALWRAIFATCGVKMPAWRILSPVTGQVMHPYFNAGVVAAPAGSGFGARWARHTKRIDRNPIIPQKRPWVDQLALGVTVAEAAADGAAIHTLTTDVNYPVGNQIVPPAPAPLPAIVHYHRWDILTRESRLKAIVQRLAADLPSLGELLSDSQDWQRVVSPYHLATPAKGTPDHTWSVPYPEPDLFITGIPRSGTSYLTRLLHQVQDCVAINEPRQVNRGLKQLKTPGRLAIEYKLLRRDILHGVHIENKVAKGQIIEDTTTGDHRDDYLPHVTRPDFLLATKNTIGYTSRIRQLRQVMPHAPIFACVRDPYDTIASWSKSFPHLESGDFRKLPVGSPDDPWLGPQASRRLKEIHAVKDVPTRRALLWAHLARTLREERTHVHVIRYERLVADPQGHIQAILDATPGAPPLVEVSPLKPSEPRSKRANLSAEDEAAIRSICAEEAAYLGYKV